VAEPTKPAFDHEAVIARLINEQVQTKKIILQIEKTLRSDPEFDGLTALGGVKAILKRFHEEQDKARALEKELHRLQHKKPAR
jgi:hypothetical protein